jgi:superfamily II DNA/RNA helicase
MDKVELLTRVLQAQDRGLTMIFARTKRTVQRVADDLADRGFAAAAVHGDLGQGAREQALRAFRSGKVDVLVATDVAARGIDVDDVTHVVNYQCPEDAKTYVHRIGRTGRAGKTGVAVTLVDWDELHSGRRSATTWASACPSRPRPTPPPRTCTRTCRSRKGAKGRLPHSQRTRAGLEAEYVDSEGDVGGRKRDRGRTAGKRDEEVALPERRPRKSRTRTRSRSGVVLEGEGAARAPRAAAPRAAAPRARPRPSSRPAPPLPVRPPPPLPRSRPRPAPPPRPPTARAGPTGRAGAAAAGAAAGAPTAPPTPPPPPSRPTPRPAEPHPGPARVPRSPARTTPPR